MRKKTIAVGTVIIAGASYLAGILTAPKSGKKTRKDIMNNVSKARIEAEKNLKTTHSELKELIKEAETKGKKLSAKAKAELAPTLKKAKDAKEKTREMLSAVRNGEADDPSLNAVIEEVKLAKKNLITYLKKK